MLLKHLRFTIAWAVVVTFLSLIPGNELPIINWMDEFYGVKMVHIGLYAPFAFLLCIWRFQKQSSYNFLRLKGLWYAFFIATGWGILMELLQGILPIQRDCSVFDMMANAVGSGIGVYAYKRFYQRKLAAK